MRRTSILFLCLCLASLRLQANGVYDVRSYGAKGDGLTLDHVAINKAIEAATNAGGGQVVLAAGTYLCGSIRLKSNVDLHLMAGAKILAAPASMKAYDPSVRTKSSASNEWMAFLKLSVQRQRKIMRIINMSSLSMRLIEARCPRYSENYFSLLIPDTEGKAAL